MTISSPPVMTSSAADRDAAQVAALRRYRLVATALFGFFVVLFAVAQAGAGESFWIRLLASGAEAAIVGGLADWFAVTALFRRPLGLPIPHTAIVPRQKDRVGDWLGTFVVDNFLASHAIAKELKSLDLLGHAARWLADRGNAERTAGRVVELLPHLLAALDDRDMRRLLAQAFRGRLIAVDLAAILAAILRALVQKGHHRALLARILPMARNLLRQNEGAFYAAVERRLWYLPRRVDKYLAKRLVEVVQDAVDEFSQPGHPGAAQLERGLLALADDLDRDEALRRRVDAAFGQALALPEVQGWLSALWDDLRRAILGDVGSPASELRRALADGISAFGETLRSDAAVAAKLTGLLDAAISADNVGWRARVARFIASEVRAWDTREFTRRMELWAGPELQYIRINGSVLGFLIGVGLFLAAETLAPALARAWH